MTNDNEAQYEATKVPQITLFFWTIKVLTTAMGESTSDYLVFHMNPVIAVGLGAAGFTAALILQLRARRYIAWVYWFAVLTVAVFGTMAADALHVVLGIPYLVSTASFALALTVIFILWYASEKTLSIHSIYTFRRELFYWATVSATFALGTAAGDMTASTLGIGFFLSGVLFAFLIAAVGVSYYILKKIQATGRFLRASADVFIFWTAYVLTRPLGASFADWMGKPISWGALGWGDGTVSVLLFVPILCLVWYLARTRRDIPSSSSVVEHDEWPIPAK